MVSKNYNNTTEVNIVKNNNYNKKKKGKVEYNDYRIYSILYRIILQLLDQERREKEKE